jgi:hypothetical protein
MPKAVHDLAKKLARHKDVKTPWALATWLVQHRASDKETHRKKRKRG